MSTWIEEPSDEELASLCAFLVEAEAARSMSPEIDDSIRANLMILKRRGARFELAQLHLTTTEITTREQQVAFLGQTARAVIRTQAKLD